MTVAVQKTELSVKSAIQAQVEGYMLEICMLRDASSIH